MLGWHLFSCNGHLIAIVAHSEVVLLDAIKGLLTVFALVLAMGAANAKGPELAGVSREFGTCHAHVACVVCDVGAFGGNLCDRFGLVHHIGGAFA